MMHRGRGGEPQSNSPSLNACPAVAITTLLGLTDLEYLKGRTLVLPAGQEALAESPHLARVVE